MSKVDELAKIAKEKKALNKKQKKLREELEDSKAERKKVREIKAECRSVITEQKAHLRSLTAKISESFSEFLHDDIIDLADDILEIASEISATVRKFGEAEKSLHHDELK